MKIFRDLWWYFKQEKKSYVFGILILLLISLLGLFPPFVVGIIVDLIAEGTLTQQQLIFWSALLLLAGLLSYALRYVWRILIFGASIRLGKLLRNQLYVHFTNMSPRFYQQRKVGDLMAHATNDIQAIEATAGEGVLTLVDSITVGGLVIMMMAFFIHAPLTLISLISMPFMAWAMMHYGRLMHERFYQAQSAFSSLNNKVQENVSGVRVVKAFGLEEREKISFQEQTTDVVHKNIAVARIEALFEPTISLIVGLSFFIAIAFGSIFVVREELTIGQLTTFTMYLGLLIWPMLAFGFLFNIVEKGRASYDRVRALLQIKADIEEHPGAIDQPPQGELQVSIPSFMYTEQEHPVLKEIYFELKQGQTLGIVGKTGAGKTTLLRLLLREFDCQEGNITIGGTSIYALTLKALRQAIGYVPQDQFLFSCSIAENISFGKPEATLEEIKHAAKLASIHEDILRLDEGYATMVGERGVTLSGGQKQRISIARALLLQPEVLILDDSLSAVDAKTEEAILQALKQNRKNKTTIISAHRLSAIEHADLILVLEEGKILERGTHQQLLQRNGWYKAMYQRQQLEVLVAQGGT